MTSAPVNSMLNDKWLARNILDINVKSVIDVKQTYMIYKSSQKTRHQKLNNLISEVAVGELTA